MERSGDEENEEDIKKSHSTGVVSMKTIEDSCNTANCSQDIATPQAPDELPPQKSSDIKMEITPGGGARRRSRWGPIHGTYEDKVKWSGAEKEECTARDGVDTANLPCATVNEGPVESPSDVDMRNVRLQQVNSVEKKSPSFGIKSAGRSINQESYYDIPAKDKCRTVQSKESDKPTPTNQKRTAIQNDELEKNSQQWSCKEETKKNIGDCKMLKSGRQEPKKYTLQAEMNASPGVSETILDAADAQNPKSTVSKNTEPNKISVNTPRHANVQVEFREKKSCFTVSLTPEPGLPSNQEMVNPLQNEIIYCAENSASRNSAVQAVHLVHSSSKQSIEPDQSLKTISSNSNNISLSESRTSFEGTLNTGGLKNVSVADMLPIKV